MPSIFHRIPIKRTQRRHKPIGTLNLSAQTELATTAHTNCVHLFYTQILSLGHHAMWPHLAKFCHFGEKFTSLWQIFDGLFLIWQICYISGLIFVIAKGQKSKHNLTIWLHWHESVQWVTPMSFSASLTRHESHKILSFYILFFFLITLSLSLSLFHCKTQFLHWKVITCI